MTIVNKNHTECFPKSGDIQYNLTHAGQKLEMIECTRSKMECSHSKVSRAVRVRANTRTWPLPHARTRAHDTWPGVDVARSLRSAFVRARRGEKGAKKDII